MGQIRHTAEQLKSHKFFKKAKAEALKDQGGNFTRGRGDHSEEWAKVVERINELCAERNMDVSFFFCLCLPITTCPLH